MLSTFFAINIHFEASPWAQFCLSDLFSVCSLFDFSFYLYINFFQHFPASQGTSGYPENAADSHPFEV